MKINLAVWWVLDYETGERETIGGLERWTRDITNELVALGHDVCIYQKSNINYTKNYCGAKIFGIKCSKNFAGNLLFYQKFKKLADNTAVTVFLSQDLVWGSDFKYSIAVNHGVWWSSKQSYIKRYIISLVNYRYISLVQKTICVDTNYINWVIESVPCGYKLKSKLKYIPNYFDSSYFGSRERECGDTVKILFPRRVMGLNLNDEPRGGKDAITAVARIIKDGYKIKLTILGEGNLISELKKLTIDFGIEESVCFNLASFDKINEYYVDNDIVLVPSRFSEGTSLSAIEGLASGCYVIGSCIGGLQNLPLFPPFGDMVEPDPTALEEAIRNYLLRRGKFNKELKKLQPLVVQRFELKNWREKILREIFSVVDNI